MFDDRKRRVTDLDQCNRVTIHKPLKVNEEVLLELRRELHNKIYIEHRAAFIKIGEQISNMTEEKLRGLRSLKEDKSRRDPHHQDRQEWKSCDH